MEFENRSREQVKCPWKRFWVVMILMRKLLMDAEKTLLGHGSAFIIKEKN